MADLVLLVKIPVYKIHIDLASFNFDILVLVTARGIIDGGDVKKLHDGDHLCSGLMMLTNYVHTKLVY